MITVKKRIIYSGSNKIGIIDGKRPSNITYNLCQTYNHFNIILNTGEIIPTGYNYYQDLVLAIKAGQYIKL